MGFLVNCSRLGVLFVGSLRCIEWGVVGGAPQGKGGDFLIEAVVAVIPLKNGPGENSRAGSSSPRASAGACEYLGRQGEKGRDRDGRSVVWRRANVH